MSRGKSCHCLHFLFSGLSYLHSFEWTNLKNKLKRHWTNSSNFFQLQISVFCQQMQTNKIGILSDTTCPNKPNKQTRVLICQVQTFQHTQVSRAVVVVQLTEHLHPTPVEPGSNPAFENLFKEHLFTVKCWKTNTKGQELLFFKKLISYKSLKFTIGKFFKWTNLCLFFVYLCLFTWYN